MFKAPVVRFGCLVSPKGQSVDRKPLDYKLGRDAVAELDRTAPVFDEATATSILQGLEPCQVPVHLLNENDVQRIKLRKPHRAPTLGVAYDFSDIPFEMAGALIIARACVTVCVQGQLFESERREYNFSKFWTRFLYVRKTGDPALNDILSLAELREFELRCELISKRLIANMQAPYEQVLRNITEDRKLEVEVGPHFLAVAAVTDTPDFEELYAAIQAGEDIGLFLGRNKVADQLAQLGMSYFPTERPKKSAGFLGKLDPHVSIIPYQGADLYRGIFFKSMSGEWARFVGVGRPPKGADKVADVQSNPSQNAASVVTASLISEFASQF